MFKGKTHFTVHMSCVDEDRFLDQTAMTAEQRFVLMLHERVEHLEKDNTRMMAMLFPTPKNGGLAEISKPLHEKLKVHKATFDHLVITSVEKNDGQLLIPEVVLTALPKEAVRDACEFARLTKSHVKYAHIFDYAITLLERSGNRVTPEMITWIEEVAEENVRKLSS